MQFACRTQIVERKQPFDYLLIDFYSSHNIQRTYVSSSRVINVIILPQSPRTTASRKMKKTNFWITWSRVRAEIVQTSSFENTATNYRRNNCLISHSCEWWWKHLRNMYASIIDTEGHTSMIYYRYWRTLVYNLL